jgi:glycosyltransferase involved in cell wall biosynthesis
MKILQINFSDFASGGGGAIAMYRLYLGLKRAGVDCKILSGLKTLDSADSLEIPRSRRLESGIRRLTAKIGLNDIHCLSSFKIREISSYIDADILNFHVIHSGFFSYLAIPSLTETKPAVFTLHDTWSFTGHCAYSYDCDRWKTGCGKCPYPETYPAIQRDNTHLEWTLKHWVYERSNLAIVTPSRWLAEQAHQSMLSRFPIRHIPNGVETDLYRPLDSEQCKSILGIPAGKRVLMFGAEILGDLRKGADLLLKALQSLPSTLKPELLLLTFGNSGDAIAKSADIEVFNLGYIGGDRMKAIAYSAADLFLFPTRADNLPLVLQESMACGTPMVSFKVGGVPDLVRPGVTGYLAEPEDIQDFQKGILELMEDHGLREQMSQNCRAIALQEYSLVLQTQRYIELYKQILDQNI